MTMDCLLVALLQSDRRADFDLTQIGLVANERSDVLDFVPASESVSNF